jgi:hypothetical protein
MIDLLSLMRVRTIPITTISIAAMVMLLLACTAESTRVPFNEENNNANEPVDSKPKETAAAEQQEPVRPAGTSASTTPAETPPVDANCKRSAPSNVCGVTPQCGCAPTHTCDVVDSKGTARCVTAGRAPMGQPCTATAGCALGLTCIGGTCHAFCNDPGKACTAAKTGLCTQIKNSADQAIPNLAICRVACAPEDPTSCGGKTNAGVGVCIVDGSGGTDCQSGGERTESQTCGPNEECGPGLVCTTRTVGSTTTSTCKRWCRVGQNDCGAGKTCGGFSPEVKVGTLAYGACP